MNFQNEAIELQKVFHQDYKTYWEETEAIKAHLEARFKSLGLLGAGKSLPIGDVEILLKGLEHIGEWGDEEEERWDDPGDCAMDTLYRYSMSIR